MYRIGVIPLGFDDLVVSIDVCLRGHALDIILNLAGLLAQGGGEEVFITAIRVILGIIGCHGLLDDAAQLIIFIGNFHVVIIVAQHGFTDQYRMLNRYHLARVP
ncbi:hypothetical protein D3C76_1038880 [compost metagenome]